MEITEEQLIIVITIIVSATIGLAIGKLEAENWMEIVRYALIFAGGTGLGFTYAVTKLRLTQ